MSCRRHTSPETAICMFQKQSQFGFHLRALRGGGENAIKAQPPPFQPAKLLVASLCSRTRPKMDTPRNPSESGGLAELRLSKRRRRIWLFTLLQYYHKPYLAYSGILTKLAAPLPRVRQSWSYVTSAIERSDVGGSSLFGCHPTIAYVSSLKGRTPEPISQYRVP